MYTISFLQTVVLCLSVVYQPKSVSGGTGLYMGPYFPSPQPKNITVHQDTVAYLACTVKQLGDKSVSWVRQRDADILTVDRYTFVRDERLTVHYIPDTETWTLVIKYVQERDAGSYECQISTEPKMSMLVHLNVIVPQVEVLGAVDKYVRKGSTARLECRVSSTVQLPDYIFWYHSGERVLEYHNARVKISMSRRGGQGSEMSITSTLVITNAMSSDEGNYTCLPSNLHAATTILHVLTEEHPAAMQTGAAMLTDPPSPWGMLFVVILALILAHAQLDFVNTDRKRTVQPPVSFSDDWNDGESKCYREQTVYFVREASQSCIRSLVRKNAIDLIKIEVPVNYINGVKTSEVESDQIKAEILGDISGNTYQLSCEFRCKGGTSRGTSCRELTTKNWIGEES